MIRRLTAPSLRYAAVHANRLASVSLGPVWRRFGVVEQVERRDDQVIVTGWADASHLRLIWPDGQYCVTPSIARPDVAAGRGFGTHTGFELVAPAQARPLTLEITRAGHPVQSIAIVHPDDPATPAARRRMTRAFLRDLLRAAPAAWRYFRQPSERTKTALKRALRLDVATRGKGVEPAWLTEPPVVPARTTPVTVIVPVYNALPLLQRCLARLEAHTDLPCHVIVVEDASSDPEVRIWLKAWAEARQGGVTLLCHRRNRGFVGAVNHGLEVALARGGAGPVVLLNSDGMVARGWAGRLIAPLRDRSVASVTPMSNAAEIFTVPQMCRGLDLRGEEVDALDAAAAGLGDVTLPDAPTGVGFCMALSRDWLAHVPRFDTAFGRGYGEEVDWCQKTRALGARHLCQPCVFVQHIGGQSFGSEEKRARQRAVNAMIASRYPAYDAEVQRFILDDPLSTPRLALALALASLRSPRLPLFLAHSMGGGAEQALMAEVRQQDAALILRVGGSARWQLEVHVDGQSTAGQTEDLAVVRRLLAEVPALDLIYSCGVGDCDPVTLPGALMSLRRQTCEDRLALRIHDYFPLSPSYTLLGTDGFTGVPPEQSADPAHGSLRPDGRLLSLRRWRAAWRPLVEAAHETVVFSRASADLVAQCYPEARVVVRPHAPSATLRPVRLGPRQSFGVLGNLNRQKGAYVLRDIAKAHPEVSFVVIGCADSAIALPRNVTLHGAYAPEQIPDLAERYGIGAWLFPAIWPETFSFATREALATGLMVAGFDLGAQGEVLRDASNGCVVPLAPDATAPDRLFAALTASLTLTEAAE